MDPLSISASVSGLLGLACATVTKLDDLFNNVFRSRPAVLLAVSEEMSALCLVLGELEGRLRDSGPRNMEDDKKSLLAVLNGCMRTFQLLSAQLGELQSKFQRGSLRKALGFLLYPGRMREIAALREDLEKYKATLLIALQVHKPMESMSVESLRQDIEDLRSKILEMPRRDTSVDLERMDVIKDYLTASSMMLSVQDPSAVVEDPYGSANAGGRQAARGRVSGSVTREIQVGPSTSTPRNETASSPTNPGSDVPTFRSFGDWLSKFVPDSGANADENLSAFRNRRKSQRKSNPMNSATVPPAAIETIEVASPAEMIPDSEALSLISQHLPLRNALPEGQIHVVFVDLRKPGSRQTFTEDLITSPDTPIYKLIHELHSKGYTPVCGFQSMDKQSTYSPIVSHDSLLPVVVTGGPSQYNIPSGLQINADERLIDFFNRFILDDTATPAKDIISIKRCGGSIRIYDGRTYSMSLKFHRTLRIPEDGKSYPLPAFFGVYPLLNVETFSDRLPPLMRKKGGLFIPMFQREALSLGFDPVYCGPESFAIRVYAGSVNAITGKTAQSQLNDGGQDYVVIPKQRRLDGFFAGKDEVKQFVAMPLGFGYSVEKQVTGTEFIGGIQLEIIPRLSDRVKFIRFSHDFVKSPWLPQQLETSEDIFKTPRQLGIVSGQRLLMKDMMKQSKRKNFGLGFLDDINLGDTRRQDLFPVHDEKCRPTFVHEMFSGTGRHTYSMKKSLVLYPVKPLSVRVDWQEVMRSPKGTSVEKYSPFLDISDFKRHISSIKHKLEPSPRAGYLLFNGTVHKGFPDEYSPLSEYALDGGIVSFQEDPSVGDRGRDYRAGLTGATQKDPSWEMTLGAGGTLGQSIEKTEDERLWNWGASKFINVQILNSVAFKKFTSISPVTPISFREYVKASIPFYSFLPLGKDAVISDGAVAFKSISQFDRRDTTIGIHMDASNKPVGCANCEDNLCDSILQPCNHTFCSNCIKFDMTKHSSITCAFCGKAVSKTVVFSAPMEMPLPSCKETNAPEPVIQNPVDDVTREATCETSSSVIVQRQEDNRSSSELVKNLVVVLLELAKNEESPKAKGTLNEDISHLVDDAIMGSHAVSFNMAIRHLTQATIDIRIPVLKAALPKALRHESVHHVRQLLLLVPNVDDLDDHNNNFVRTSMESAHGGEVFVIMFQWITGGSRSIEDFGLSVKGLFVLACSEPALDLLLQFIADRKQTLAECGVSIMTAGKIEISKVAKLIQHGCDPNERDAAGRTLIHLRGDSASEIEKLLSLGARIDAVDNEGNTGIHLSVPPNAPGYVYHESKLAVLLRDKSCTPAVVNVRNRDGLTAYHLSLTRPIYVRKRLLAAGADPKLDIPNGKHRDKVLDVLKGKDWRKEGYLLDDRLVRELQDASES